MIDGAGNSLHFLLKDIYKLHKRVREEFRIIRFFKFGEDIFRMGRLIEDDIYERDKIP